MKQKGFKREYQRSGGKDNSFICQSEFLHTHLFCSMQQPPLGKDEPMFYTG